MSGSFSIALSGLNADAAALDVVGNNLANLNTTGYKTSTLSFYDLLAQSIGGGAIQIGGGVSATFSQREFTQGSIQLSGGASMPRCKATDSSSCTTTPATFCTPAPATSTWMPTATSSPAPAKGYKVGRPSTA